jgi:uncharacterized membrane protein YtjA (UPF0391 family)
MAGGVGSANTEASTFTEQENDMLKWALIFAVIAAVAGVLGFGGVAAGAAGIAKVLFVLFLVAFFVVLGLIAFGVNTFRK